MKAIRAGFAAALFALAACGSEAQNVAEIAEASGPVEAETVADGLAHPWGLAFLPDGAMLVTERNGGVVRVSPAGEKTLVSGGPEGVLRQGQSGLLDVALDPRFAENGLVYISFMQAGRDANRLALYRARYEQGALVDGRVIFRASPREGAVHPGGRMAFLPDETLLLFVGVPDPLRDNAQDLSNHLGKVLRIDREGRPPADNPFVARAGAAPEIYSYGHRNAMGLARDGATGAIWLHENGPRGGDELNRLEAGANYGWPIVTYGREYSGGVITEERSRPGMVDPVTQWTPSIAPSGMAVYRGDAFAAWEGDLLIGFLAGEQVRRVRVGEGGVRQETLLTEEGRRIRDVRLGPDGFVYLLTDADNGALLRVRPAG